MQGVLLRGREALQSVEGQDDFIDDRASLYSTPPGSTPASRSAMELGSCQLTMAWLAAPTLVKYGHDGLLGRPQEKPRIIRQVLHPWQATPGRSKGG